MKIKGIKTFYVPRNTIDKKITGWGFPQCQDFLKGMEINVDSPRGAEALYRSISHGFKFPDYKPLLSGLKLAKNAKPTDFLSSISFYTPLLSKRAIDCLSELNIGQHRIYPVRVYSNLKPILYFYAGIFEMKQSEYIIWDKCRFYETKLALKSADLDSIYDKRLNTEVPVFKSVDDYRDFGGLHSLEVETIAVNANFPMDIDYFEIYNGMSGRFVSERFVETVKRSGLTGLDFEDTVRVVQYV